MNLPDAPASFVAAWRARWPEWDLAQIFIPAAQRDAVDAWFALLQTLTDAAWGGSDPTPGLAKLAWWHEELQGWSKGARRHPLGELLQRLPAPWSALSAALLSLQKSREIIIEEDAATTLLSFASAVAACESALFGPSTDPSKLIAQTLLDERRLCHLQVATTSKHTGPDVSSDIQARSAAPLRSNPARDGTTPRRIHDAIVRARLARAVENGRTAPLSPWRTVLTAWRAARGSRPAT
ncbi:MAG: phytoene/squalene synthase family protein [Luteimonas sp.]